MKRKGMQVQFAARGTEADDLLEELIQQHSSFLQRWDGWDDIVLAWRRQQA